MKAGDNVIMASDKGAQIYGEVRHLSEKKIEIFVINGAWTMTLEVTKLQGNYNDVLRKYDDARKVAR